MKNRPYRCQSIGADVIRITLELHADLSWFKSLCTNNKLRCNALFEIDKYVGFLFSHMKPQLRDMLSACHVKINRGTQSFMIQLSFLRFISSHLYRYLYRKFWKSAIVELPVLSCLPWLMRLSLAGCLPLLRVLISYCELFCYLAIFPVLYFRAREHRCDCARLSMASDPRAAAQWNLRLIFAGRSLQGQALSHEPPPDPAAYDLRMLLADDDLRKARHQPRDGQRGLETAASICRKHPRREVLMVRRIRAVSPHRPASGPGLV